MQAQSAQSLRASASQQHYAFWSACFRRRANCYNKHTFCRSRQKWVSRCKIIVEKKMCRPRKSQLKTAGTLFAQHYSCPAVLRCSVGLTMAAFLGTPFGVCQIIASIAQPSAGCTQSARRLC